jgi:hypothetical protein
MRRKSVAHNIARRSVWKKLLTLDEVGVMGKVLVDHPQRLNMSQHTSLNTTTTTKINMLLKLRLKLSVKVLLILRLKCKKMILKMKLKMSHHHDDDEGIQIQHGDETYH